MIDIILFIGLLSATIYMIIEKRQQNIKDKLYLKTLSSAVIELSYYRCATNELEKNYKLAISSLSEEFVKVLPTLEQMSKTSVAKAKLEMRSIHD